MLANEMVWIAVFNAVGVGALLVLYFTNKATISELKQKTLQLGQERARDKALLESLGEGIVVTDQNGNVELINKTAGQLVGWEPEEVVGKKWYNISPLVDDKGNVIPPERRATQRVLETGEPIFSSKYNYVRRDGTKFPVATTAAPVVIDNKTVGVIAVFRDITIEKEVDLAKSEFVALASHQLRTPLSAIKWFTEMLLAGDAGPLNTEQTEYANNVAISNQRMIDLVSSLLNISRIESGRIIINPEPTDMGKLATDVVKQVQKKIDEKHQSLTLLVEPDLPAINIDQKLISQVYLNLLTNAIKYTPDGGKLAVGISRKDGDIISQVSDSGVGVPAADQKKIFDKFFRAGNAVKMETDGTGLGLYLAKSVVSSSGGKIWFESAEGKGTTFWFSLPVSGSQAREGEVRLIEK